MLLSVCVWAAALPCVFAHSSVPALLPRLPSPFTATGVAAAAAVTAASVITAATALAAIAYERYKIIVQVTIGELRDQGVRVASRSLWDTNTDNYASASFQNQSLWCSCMVFGVYTD